MTTETANSLLDVLQRLADGHRELKLKVTAAEEVFRRKTALYDEYVRAMDELKKTQSSSVSEALVERLRIQLVSG